MIEKLKKLNFLVLLPVTILTCLAFALSLIGVLVYSANCASEFNGGAVSPNATTLGMIGAIVGAVALVFYIVALFAASTKKTASLFSLTRILNYVSFILLLGAFLYEILDEYSLLGTILYPIVSGTIGDPVDPVLSSSFFASLIMLFVATWVALAAGIVMRKKSHKINPDLPQSEGNANE